MNINNTPFILKGDASSKKKEIREYFHDTYDIYEDLFSVLKTDEAYYYRADSLRHPIIFYLGHTAVFFVNKLRVAKIIEQRVDSRIESMLAIGVDEMSWDDMNASNYDWPTVIEVMEYRKKVRKMVDHLIQKIPLKLPINWEDPFWIILMGIEHERIHLETTSVLIRQLPITMVKSQKSWQRCNDDVIPVTNFLQTVGSGTVVQGKKLPAETFGWDNEYGQLITEVEDFKASKYLVSNRQFLEFVEDGGYLDQSWWTKEGWAWRNFRKAVQPIFWLKKDRKWYYRSMCEELSMPWSWPVDVNYLEAKAFCNWLTAKTGRPIRLPTEAQWYRLYDNCVGQNSSNTKPANINLAKYASSCPVDKFMFGDQLQFADIIGNVWQWTETAIDGLDGFKVHPAYDDFSVPTFDGKHNLIKGGSWISTGNEALYESRYAFRRHFFQHAGFRYVESHKNIEQKFNAYETDELISQYLEFHYGDEYFGVKNFPVACIEHIIKKINKDSPMKKALDLGCAVGRSSFELARHYGQVDAVDFSTRFIRNAINLCEHGEVKYLNTEEGELSTIKSFQLNSLNLGSKIHNVHFSQGDACNLDKKYHDYDLVFAGNLIDRLYHPKQFLLDITARIKPLGYLAITSPYTWLEEYTKKQNWLGGYKDNGENTTTLDGLKQALGDKFELITEPEDIPFVIRETARKHQHSIAQLTLWQKKSL
ncbi:MAG: 5-histidylcysteine sulfoxide synthase [Proteobacteria bacterium]|nr:5-histidylcysteine sulfoxide synthase [Pseudomonadota bacterium]